MEAVCLTPSATNNRWSPLLGNNLIPNTGKWSAGNNKYCKTAYDFWMLQSYEERGKKKKLRPQIIIHQYERYG